MTLDIKQSEIIKAGCKINLALNIVGRREDGYHLLDSIFWPLTYPYDTLTFNVLAHDASCAPFSVNCNIADIDTHDNTLTKAYAAFTQANGRLKQEYKNVHVYLEKNIPHGAGLGGGSSDAAAVLLWCNEHAINPLTSEELQEVALTVGADVPFFLLNRPARVQGIGEILNPLPLTKVEGYVILLCPNLYISTPWAFKKFSEKKINFSQKKLLTKVSIDYRTFFTCAGKENINSLQGNDLEEVIFEVHPQLARLKQGLIDRGAVMAAMSGSGSSLIGLVKSKQIAEQIAENFSAECKVFTVAL